MNKIQSWSHIIYSRSAINFKEFALKSYQNPEETTPGHIWPQKSQNDVQQVSLLSDNYLYVTIDQRTKKWKTYFSVKLLYYW